MGAETNTACVADIPIPKSCALDELTRRYLDAIVEFEPVEATFWGLHAADHRLGEPSEESRAGRLHRYRQLLRELRDLAPDQAAADLDGPLLENLLQRRIYDLEVRRLHRSSPSFYLETITQSVLLLLLRDTAPLEDRLEAVAARLAQVPGFLSHAVRQLQSPPEICLETALGELEGTLQFLHSTCPVLAEQNPSVGHRLLDANLMALRALSSFGDFLRRELTVGGQRNSALGRDRFVELLRLQLMVSGSPLELEEIAREVIASTKVAMERLASKAGHGGWLGLLGEIQGEHPDGSSLLDCYRTAVKKARRFLLEKNLISIPDGLKLEIAETPASLRPLIGTAAYIPPSPLGEDATGHFLVTPVPDDESCEARLRGHNRAFIRLTAVHEAFPGHHLQLSMAKLGGSTLRRLAESPAFVEGWALYGEEMMEEAGFYDRHAKFLRLKDLLWRACRAVIDVGLHTGSMSFQEALDLLEDEVKLHRNGAISEVTWASLFPTYPLSYLVGQRQMLSFRQRWLATKESGLRAFHDKLLSAGALPLPLVERHLFPRAPPRPKQPKIVAPTST